MTSLHWKENTAAARASYSLVKYAKQIAQIAMALPRMGVEKQIRKQARTRRSTSPL